MSNGLMIIFDVALPNNGSFEFSKILFIIEYIEPEEEAPIQEAAETPASDAIVEAADEESAAF